MRKDGTDREYAIKIIPRRKLERHIRAIHSHHYLLSTLDHLNVVKFYHTYEDEGYFYSVMELLKGNELVDYSRKTCYSEIEVSQFMRQAFLAVEYLHSRNVVHRDLKPTNFFKVTDGPNTRVVLLDFGFAKVADPYEVLETRTGTPYYIAPEVIDREYDHRSDFWSLGVMMYELLVRDVPFYANTTPAVLKLILNTEVNFEGDKWKNISADAKDLVRKLLEKNPFKRITADGVLKHPWIVMGEEAKARSREVERAMEKKLLDSSKTEVEEVQGQESSCETLAPNNEETLKLNCRSSSTLDTPILKEMLDSETLRVNAEFTVSDEEHNQSH